MAGETGRADADRELEDKVIARAKNTAYRLLTYRPRSRAEIVQKLGDRGFEGAIVEAVVASLERLGYIDDRQFAEQWASSRVRLRGFGRRRIEQELRSRGVDRDIIAEAFADVFSAGTELETARSMAAKKIVSLKSADEDTRRRRLAGFLERKGFSFDVIRKVIQEVE